MTERKKVIKKDLVSIHNSSVLSLRQVVHQEQDSIPSKYSAFQRFIPFIRERDSIGRIVIPEVLPEKKKRKLITIKIWPYNRND